MGLKVSDWLFDRFGYVPKERKLIQEFNGVQYVGYSIDTAAKVFYKELAIQSCVSFIANALVMCEFQTIENNQSVKDKTYYLLNIQPNQNQNAVEFWHQVISTLVNYNECLVVRENEEFFVCDPGFTHKKYVYFPDYYENVTIRDLPLRKGYAENEVFYFQLNNNSIRSLIDGLFSDYAELLTSAHDMYKHSGGLKLVLNDNAPQPLTPEDQEAQDREFKERFTSFLKSVNGVLGLSNDEKITDLTSKSNITTKDFRDLIDDVFKLTASAFHISSAVLKGDVVGIDNLTDNTITFGIKPFAHLITSEINRKYWGREMFLKGYSVKMDMSYIKNIDIVKLSQAAENLFRIGVNSIDDNLELFNRPRLNTEFSTARFVTKNYSEINEYMKENNLKGGDENGNGKTDSES